MNGIFTNKVNIIDTTTGRVIDTRIEQGPAVEKVQLINKITGEIREVVVPKRKGLNLDW